ncbi:ABC transporter related [Halothermothrix orenii H 168]|uniref:ABC transporter related n=2 Tax=Halothermothrix orenii TaxID=31909 RepID=B8CZC5_HALOH|nr:ABC transporter related [Halothermothrix orenii H 168]
MLFHAGITIFFVDVFKNFIKTVITGVGAGEKGLTDLAKLAIVMIVIFFVKGIVYYGQRYLVSYVSHKAIRDIRNDLYAHLQNLSLSFFNKNKTGEMISRVTNDVNRLQSAIVNGTISVFYQVVVFILGIGYLFILNPRLTMFLIIVLPAMTYLLSRFNKKIRRVSKNVQMKIADVSDVLQETLSAIRVVKSFCREDYEFKRFSSENEANFRAKVKTAQYGAILTPSIEFLAAMAFTAILWYGGYEVLKGRMDPSELITFFLTLLYLTTPLKSLSKLSSTIQQALAAAERIFETMDIDTHIEKETEKTRALTEVEGKIEFKNVTFGYNENEPVLKNINLTANPGESIALVGPSGAGKTTLVDLIPRFYDPVEGKVLLDGIDIKKINLTSLRENIGIVPQETVLFSGTVYENIAYGNLDATEEEIIRAAKAANAHDFIINFKKGYHTVIGERGVGLSGGQRQRIAIARAILKNPRILIFDEATSALDAESEALVQDALNKLMKNRTTFIIAHRLSTIKNADRIVVISDGEIVDQGTHSELMAKKGLYYNLYQGNFQED